MIIRIALPIMLVALLSLVLLSCGGCPDTPEGQLTAAKEAKADEDYAAAYKLYQGLLNWQGEGAATQSQRFQAVLESIKCQIHLGQFEEAVESFVKLENTFAEEMGAPGAHKYALAVTHVLVDKKAPVLVTAEVLAYAGEKYPDQKDDFDKHGKALKEMATTDEEREALKKLGYL